MQKAVQSDKKKKNINTHTHTHKYIYLNNSKLIFFFLQSFDGQVKTN